MILPSLSVGDILAVSSPTNFDMESFSHATAPLRFRASTATKPL